MRDRDELYADAGVPDVPFAFDERVAAVFADMIGRSVPGYASIIAMTELLARQYALPHSNLYDLGCSLGAASAAMQSGVRVAGCRIHAVDNAPAMIRRAKSLLDLDADPGIRLVCRDILDQSIEDASMVVLNFTLQFVAVSRRAALLSRIRAGMRPGGVLILSEKIAGENPQEDRLFIDLHHGYKRANGYSDMEISRKRAALEDVLIPETLATHRQRLREAGFGQVVLWFQCFNFASLIARP